MEKVSLAQGREEKMKDFFEENHFNLSDFAFFLSVMKDKRAHRDVLSIILNEEDLELVEVKVEQVVLNSLGKRAIRLDAWAMDTKNRQFSTEMQNDSRSDDVKKRSRFYQGLLDTPLLKSGKQTKYKNLPSTVIIFITQEDIFGKDLACYTFTEQCEEVPGLPLGDGTKKIFLNMKSKNGRPELVSLLQYMKHTTMENPEIIIKDSRIVELSEVVEEVKQSEEWETIRMNILEYGIEKGIEKGRQRLFIELVCKKLSKGKAPEVIAEELEEDLVKIRNICEAALPYAPEYDLDKVCDACRNHLN